MISSHHHPIRSLTLLLLGALGSGLATAATWTPLSTGQTPRTAEVSATSVFNVPQSIAARGGSLVFTLVGGGEGGHASKSSCEDYAVQGGKGGDGGEVLEVTISMQPGQCSGGIGIVIGNGGKGALRAGNGALVGEPGGSTTIDCSGTVMATALGGGRRRDSLGGTRSARGGIGGAISNAMEAATAATIDQRTLNITPGTEGQSGYGGYASGGGGGGASLSTIGTMVKNDGTVIRRSVTRNAPAGKGGYGAGTGAGTLELASDATVYPAENAVQYGGGGGGGAAACGVPASAREGGNAVPGFVKIQWLE